MHLFLVLFFLAISVALLYYYVTIRPLKRATINIPEIPSGLPIIGHLHNYKNLVRLFIKHGKMTDEVGGIMKVWFGPLLYFVVSDPNIAHTLLNTCLRKGPVYKFSHSWVGEGLITAEVATWKVHRKLLNPTFSQHVLASFQEVFNRTSRRLVEDLQVMVGNGEFDHNRYLMKNALEAICQTAFCMSEGEVSKDAQLSEEYLDAANRTIKIYAKRFTIPQYYFNAIYNMSQMKKLETQLVTILKDLPREVLKKRRKAMQSPGYEKRVSANRFKTFMELLIEMGDAGQLTDEEIRDEVDTMVLAGYETTSTAVLYLLSNLRTYPDVQERVYQEIVRVVGSADKDVLKDDLSKLEYMEAVIKESLRLFPIIPFIMRKVDQDVKLSGGRVVPAGTSMFVNIYSMQRSDRWGADARDFNPDRWLDPANPPDEKAFYAFSVGRRNCIGKAYAMASMKTILVHLLRRYKITGKQDRLKLTIDVLMKPKAGHHIALELR